MVGETVMTEHHCRGSLVAQRPVALAAYGMDSRHVRRVETADGSIRNEVKMALTAGRGRPRRGRA